MSKPISIKDLITDPRNTNRGSEAGQQLIEKSINEVGFARSIVVSNDNVALAGNHVLKEAKKRGARIIEVETEGESLVVVKRKDVDSRDPKAGLIGIYDNQANKVNYTPDFDQIQATTAELSRDPAEFGFTPEEFEQPASAADDTTSAPPSDGGQVGSSFQVVVECADEDAQRDLYERMTAEGKTCRLLTL